VLRALLELTPWVAYAQDFSSYTALTEIGFDNSQLIAQGLRRSNTAARLPPPGNARTRFRSSSPPSVASWRNPAIVSPRRHSCWFPRFS
jgi:hypothetical protein